MVFSHDWSQKPTFNISNISGGETLISDILNQLAKYNSHRIKMFLQWFMIQCFKKTPLRSTLIDSFLYYIVNIKVAYCYLSKILLNDYGFIFRYNID